MDEGREEWSPRSEFGVWLPKDLAAICGESIISLWRDAPDDRLEFTLLDRREDAESRCRCPREPSFPPLEPRRFAVPELKA